MRFGVWLSENSANVTELRDVTLGSRRLDKSPPSRSSVRLVAESSTSEAATSDSDTAAAMHTVPFPATEAFTSTLIWGRRSQHNVDRGYGPPVGCFMAQVWQTQHDRTPLWSGVLRRFWPAFWDRRISRDINGG